MACSEPKDRVYALLGVATDTEQLGITADYNKSYEEVLLDVTASIIKKQSDLEPLRCWLPSNNDEGGSLPSWVSHWPSLESTADFLSNYDASGSWSGTASFSMDRRCMYMHGIRIACLIEKIPGFKAGFALTRALSSSHLSQLESVIFRAKTFLDASPENLSQADEILTSTIFNVRILRQADCSTAETISTLLTLISLAKQHLQQVDEGSFVKLFSLVKDLPTEQREIAENLIMACRLAGRTVCLADQHRICLAPAHAQAGDIVTVFRGGSNLYVIRPTGKKFRYVGDALMYGFMNGEATQEPNWKKKIEKLSII